MRTLPQAPNLDYLKQQAKDLLAALREIQSDASLSDAQRTLAQQYGFHAWTDLKAEVERLRAESQLFDADIAAGIAKAFDLGEITAPAVQGATDVMGPWLRLETEKGTWSVHAVMSGFEDEQAEEAVRLMDAAREAGITVPRAMRNTAGGLLEEVGEHRWRVDQWLELGPTIASPVSSANAFKAGQLLATLHGLDLEHSKQMHPWLAAEPRSSEEWNRILSVVEKAEVSWTRALADALPAILDIGSAAVEAPVDGLVLTHTDFQPSSTHLGRDGALVPTGWEFAGAITPSWHIGLVLDSWCAMPNTEINEVTAKAILHGYASIAGSLPHLDVSIFSPVIVAWLNWLVSRMSIALNGEGEDRERATRELTHMLAFPKKRTTLERLLRAAGGA